MRVAPEIVLTDAERLRIAGILGSRKTTAEIARRLSIVLLAADAMKSKVIAKRLRTSEECVSRWRRRFAQAGLDAVLVDASRSGRPPSISAAMRAEIIARTTGEKPAGRTHWSRTSMAKVSNMSPSSVGRIWRVAGLKPHVIESFKLSNDKQFEAKVRDVVGLYLCPPDNAVVLSVDEKSQIQALDRTQPGLPLKKGRAGTMTHDYKRNGTTTLFAALNVLTGAVIGGCKSAHTHKEWLAFLKKLYALNPKDQELHVIADNYATHKHPAVKEWLAAHPRVHMHFTPTSASWLNLVERFFREITVNAIRRGVFTSVHDLIDAIDVYLSEHNRDPKPFVWTKNADDILAKVLRARAALDAEVSRRKEK